MNIAIFQSDLNVGGIQKSIINLLNNIGEDVDIDLFVFDKRDFFDVKFGKNVKINKLRRAPKLVKYLPYGLARKLYTPPIDLNKEYDLAIDFNSFWHECAIGAEKVRAKKRVMWLHSDITKKIETEFRYRINWFLGRNKFRYFDQLVAVSKGVKESFYESAKKKYHSIPISVIGNVIDTNEIFKKADEDVDLQVDFAKYNLCSVGRLGFEKGYDILLKHFAEVVEAMKKKIHLYLIGDGDERENLKKQAKDLGIANNVTFLGNKANPFKYVNLMDGFALESRYEGQGIVIWEAKALGLDIFISKNLERYNEGIRGCEDITQGIIEAAYRGKPNKVREPLAAYNEQIRRSIKELFTVDE